MENTLRYLAGVKFSEPATYWERFDNLPRQFAVSTSPINPSKERTLSALPNTGLVLARTNPQNNYFEATGRRALIMGKENGGIDEVWVHPLRILRDYQAGIVSGDSIAWLQNFPVQVETRPESFARIYLTPAGELKEIIFASLWNAGGVVHYQASSPVKLVIRFRGDLRWMWPFDANALGDVHYAFDEKLQALHMKDTTGKFYCLFGADVAPVSKLSGQFQSIQWSSNNFAGNATPLNQVYHAALYDLNKENNFVLNYAFLGTNEGKEKAIKEYKILLEQPEKLYAEQVQHYVDLLRRTVQVASPDKQFNSLFQWAIVGTDRFLAYTPGLGTALMAGYSTTARGWNGGHKNSGRPGYAWYFGRDSEWSGFAIDDYGDAEIVKQQLKFLQQYQDRSGKIFHEISSSGVVHYDAADATPLYLVLAGHYLRASGDIAFMKESWPYLKKATDFLFSTDTDGDGLIENTNQGHGWIEGGALFGAHSTFYLNTSWSQGLHDMSVIASLAGNKNLAGRYAEESKRVQKILNTDFWNDSTQFFNLGKMKDGSYQTEPTILPAVGAYLNLLEEKKVKPMLDAYAGNGFSPDWGVRILSSSSKLFKPTGYHYGSVWPLFTGLVALAEYEHGNSNQGFMHISDNMMIKNYWMQGFVEEVIHGAIYQPTGICPHQCWSETNILHPAITGMIGWKPNAVEHGAALKPRFPLSWDSVAVNNLRVGNSLLQLKMKREQKSTAYTITLLSGSEVNLSFAPELPEGMIINKATVAGKPVSVDDARSRGLIGTPLRFLVKKSVDVVFNHSRGVGMFPVTPRPQPGDSSQGYRIVSTSLNGNRYTIVLQGRSGQNAIFLLKIFDQHISSVENAEYEAPVNGVANLRVQFDESAERYSQKTVIVVLR
jgi:glycogen debranching enzyme